ncbi:MAG TPA: ABC transporter substrate-binding protein [Alphaproteobacteria bacterium]
MRRRQFIIGLGVAAVWRSFAAAAQQDGRPVIGFLHAASAENGMAGLLRGLAEGGYVEGRDFTMERRAAEGHPERLAGLAKELIARRVAVLVAAGNNGPALTIKPTTTIPIVFVTAQDPIEGGVVTSLAHPGSNITGIAMLGRKIDTKRLEFLHKLLPAGAAIGALVHPAYPDSAQQRRELQEAGAAIGRRVLVVPPEAISDIDGALADLVRQGTAGLVIAESPFFVAQRKLLVAAALRHKLATISYRREFVDDGGLLSYGTDFNEAYRQAGLYVARILGGDKPGDLPVVQPTKFELVINLKTAKALGITVPPTLLATADEVIE